MPIFGIDFSEWTLTEIDKNQRENEHRYFNITGYIVHKICRAQAQADFFPEVTD